MIIYDELRDSIPEDTINTVFSFAWVSLLFRGLAVCSSAGPQPPILVLSEEMEQTEKMDCLDHILF